MNASDWAVVGLTITLIVITGLYAWQTYRLADTAASEAGERRRREEHTAARTADAIRSELTAIRQDDLLELGEAARNAASDYRNTTADRVLQRIGRMARGRVFDGLLTHLSDLDEESVRAVVGSYGLLDSIKWRAEEFLSRSGATISVGRGEFAQLQQDIDLLLLKLEQAIALLADSHTEAV